MEALQHVVWIGGGTGAGKTSVATAIARRHDLQPYHYDWHDARDHSERVDPWRHQAMHEWASMSMDERWVLMQPHEMAQAAVASSRERMEMVIEDLLARPAEVPMIAEGFGFYPELVAPLLPSGRHAVWLLPTAGFRARALDLRGWTTPAGATDPVRARENKLARDSLLTEHVRRSAARCGLTVIDIDGERSLENVIAEVEKHFAPVLDLWAERRPASTTASDEDLRTAIVASFPRFVAACTRGHSVLERVGAHHGLEAYRLGLLNNGYLAAEYGRVTQELLRRAFPSGTRSRFGPEHWGPLIGAGFARECDGGWELTERAMRTLVEFYAEVWAEVARRSAPPALVGRVGEILERLSYSMPTTQRIDRIRAMWGNVPARTLVRLYRAIWELSIQRRARTDDVYFADWPRGAALEALSRDFASLVAVLEE